MNPRVLFSPALATALLLAGCSGAKNGEADAPPEVASTESGLNLLGTIVYGPTSVRSSPTTIDVFTPNAFPARTYVKREPDFENQVMNTLRTPNPDISHWGTVWWKWRPRSGRRGAGAVMRVGDQVLVELTQCRRIGGVVR